ncbi:hypothetical protein BDBG_08031 [Blastomyces gilchristii SLH14081]|uniref:Uncharacterized protein n=2 Tax=Blastomyces TaxID=229219 RepID=A0A179V001_BLAGS|nr:uncharacterized protein BDBG_08031 [Blastomyces gilchristii SLH14081]OAT12717.1 hypothetical protein BDBG_08031 [Blastomyces gilchristii SLH14081]
MISYIYISILLRHVYLQRKAVPSISTFSSPATDSPVLSTRQTISILNQLFSTYSPPNTAKSHREDLTKMENQNPYKAPSAPSEQARERDMRESTITVAPSSQQPLLDQDTNVNLCQLLVDTFEKVGKASGAGGLDTSKWAVKDGENLSRHRYRSNPAQYHHSRRHHHHHQQQQEELMLPQQNQLSVSGSPRIGTSHTIPQDYQQRKFYSPQHDENMHSKNPAGARGDSPRSRQPSSTSFEATTSTREGDATRIISIRDVDMDVDIGSLRALVGQCIDPGLERIVDVWEAGDTCRTLTLHFTTASKAIMFSSLLGRLHSWSKYKVDYAPANNL